MKAYELTLEHDPDRMSPTTLWHGFCSPREFAYCEMQCGDRPCGYYKAAKRRGINIDAITVRKKRYENDRNRKRRIKPNEHAEAVP